MLFGILITCLALYSLALLWLASVSALNLMLKTEENTVFFHFYSDSVIIANYCSLEQIYLFIYSMFFFWHKKNIVFAALLL